MRGTGTPRLGIEIDVNQLAQRTARLQPLPGRQFRGRLRHAPDQIAENRRTYRAAEAQIGQFADEAKLLQGAQRDLFDVHGARLRLLQRVDIHVLKVGYGSIRRSGRRRRARRRRGVGTTRRLRQRGARHQLRDVT